MNNRAIIGVYDGLDSTSTTDALSANMGRTLNEKITPLLSGTTDNPVVIANLDTGIYKVTGVYKYCDSATGSFTTDEHLLIILVNRDEEVHYTIFSPTGVIRRTIITNGEITTNTATHILGDKFTYDNKKVSTIDNGWTGIQLKSGISAHNSSSFPIRCKKQGNVIYVEGAVKGVTTRASEIGTLPEGYRPVGKKVYFTQARTGGKIDTYQINTSGLIEIMQTTATTYNASDYHFINTSFII